MSAKQCDSPRPTVHADTVRTSCGATKVRVVNELPMTVRCDRRPHTVFGIVIGKHHTCGDLSGWVYEW